MKYRCNIGKLLETKGIKQKELADAIGTTEVSISRYVNGDRIPKATTCIEIAKALDCEFEDLYSIENPKQTNADRIRAMSDEELAKFLRETVTESGENLFDCSDYEDSPACKGKMCLECGAYLQWLKSEVKE